VFPKNNKFINHGNIEKTNHRKFHQRNSQKDQNGFRFRTENNDCNGSYASRVVCCRVVSQKLQFHGKNCRTTKINEVIRLSLLLDKGSEKIKTGQILNKLDLSGWVENIVLQYINIFIINN
jgi:hypothetical protein